MSVSRSCGPELRHGRLGVEVRVRRRDDLLEGDHALRGVAIDDDHVLEVGQLLAGLEHVGEELLLGDDHARAGVGDHVADLLGPVLHVDRERRGARGHHREVAEVELGPVAEEQGDRVAALSPRPAARRRARRRARAAPPRPGDLVALGPDRDLVGPVGGGDAKRLGDGGGADRLARLRDLLHGSTYTARPPRAAPARPRMRDAGCRRARPSRTARCRSADRCGRGTG